MLKRTIFILLGIAAVCGGQEASPPRKCRYDVHISRVGPAEVYHDGAATKIENVAALKQFIETIAPGCRVTLTPIGDPKGESDFSHAFAELKALCADRHLEFRVRQIDW